MTLLFQNREKCLDFEFRLCVGRYDLKVGYCVRDPCTDNNLVDYYTVIFSFVTYYSY